VKGSRKAPGPWFPRSPAALPPVTVTDHAVVRWLQRVEGYDIEGLRRRMAASAAIGQAFGAGIVVVAGGKLVLQGDAVVTVLNRSQRRPGLIEAATEDEIAPVQRMPRRRRKRHFGRWP
jgi:hypothetical protein